jgi:NADH-quinone oxidoreductase subunit C
MPNAPAITGLQAVAEAQPDNVGLRILAPFATDAKWHLGEMTIVVPPERIVEACRALQGAGYNFFETVTAVDWYPSEPRMQVVYHVLSHTLKQRVRLHVLLSSESLSVDSITSVWPSANFYEREVFDLFGIHFAGHPRLTRIMMPLDWEGHPLRKDYPVEGYR